MNKVAYIAFCKFILLWGYIFLPSNPAYALEHIAQDKHAAVIISYGRVGEDSFPATNIRQGQFESHIRELTSGSYNIISLPDLVNAFENEKELPDRTVVITFDGGHRSILDHAVPTLLRQNVPFTIFFAPHHAERGGQYIDWATLRRLNRERLITLGLHPADYMRLSHLGETEQTRQINNARVRFREELRQEAAFFAYPFGEYSSAYRDLIIRQGFRAALGLQSGVAWSGSDLYSLPRFPMTDSHGSLQRFRMIAGALPLPVSDIAPPNPALQTNTPSIGFTIAPALSPYRDRLSCFITGQERPEIKSAGTHRVEIRPSATLEHERVRLNCTMPGPPAADSHDFFHQEDQSANHNYDHDDELRWRWFGLLLTPPPLQGEN